MWKLLIAVLFFSVVSISHGLESRVVDTEQGPVRGYRDSDNGLFAFYSIPYAKAPSGRQRFKAPLPAAARTGIFEAVDKGIICPQMAMSPMLQQPLLMTEDCLIANIFVPDTTKDNLPVVVYVHGGGYILGYGNLFLHKNLVKSKEVIVVNFNYRLGAHGFLCMGTEDIPGNAGMKDQVALLRWVKKNIKNFGGDPDDVTIAGYSAGASSVDLLMLSKMTKGLFTKVIPESGANSAAWSVQTDPIAVAKEYARSLDFSNVDDFYALEEFYKTISYEILSSKLTLNRTNSVFLFSPCVERNTEGEEFLIDSPVNILKNGNYMKLPMLYGFANMEGLLREVLFTEWKERMNNQFADFLPPDLQFESEKDKNDVINKIKKFYFGDGQVDDGKVLKYIDFFSDLLFTYSTLRSVKLHVEAGNDKIYLYEYSFVDDDTPLVLHTNVRGATHCAQSMDVSDGNFTHPDENVMTKDHRDMKKLLRDIWYNFLKMGMPVPEGSDLPAWPAVGKDWSPHMNINIPMKLGGSLLKERTLFWDEIYEKHYRQPSPPPPPPQRRIEL
ncbi:juvenile hormone esterase-like [Zerene cesonia]|uniref:juvenile hormone esterase-like n=1 Tax=Zerene cesonia TaxID=33412 RepID=UPI0018E5A0C9|nr:juvenile hormone esterase-like [Zerene cesonia]